MLGQDELWELCQRLGLTEAARAMIERIRAAPPARRVHSAAGNVSVRYPSRKMGVIIQAESHKNELAAVYEHEHDPHTLEYYDQPCQFKLTYQSKSGRSVGILHTPDFFVIRTDGVGWEEWKTEDELQLLSEKMPQRYQWHRPSGWCCPPGERYAAQFGFFYRVRSSAEIDWVFQRNLRFLEDYLRDDCPEVDQNVSDRVINLVRSRPGLSLEELFETIGEPQRDPLYRLIATERVYVDLRVAPLVEANRIRVFGHEQMAWAYAVTAEVASATVESEPHTVKLVIGAMVLWDQRPWLIANIGETRTWLRAEDGSLVELAQPVFEAMVKQGQLIGLADRQTEMDGVAREVLAQASPADLQEANRRYHIIAPLLRGDPPIDPTIPLRTQRAWLARYRAAAHLYRCGYVGLIPRSRQRGNRAPKLPAESLALLNKFIEDDYETLKQKSKRQVYGELVQACAASQVLAPSYPTFAKAIKQRPHYEQVKKRQGTRAAYPYEPFYFELNLTTPRHGDRPFEIGHIDHTELDIELVCSRTGRNLGRPWVTFLVDAFCRRLLAVYLSFEAPSYRACMMILRECVRRQGRLPQMVVVDGGREFASLYFESLLARYECAKKSRPGAKPRFGSVCERLFGTANTTFVHNLLGNTQIMQQTRQVTKAVNPKQLAVWDLSRLYHRLAEWAYEVYDTIDHPALGQSPREAFVQGMAQSGQRLHRLIPFDEDFRMMTLPTTAKGTALVQPNVGVKINSIYYWADAFRNREVERTRVPVRYDPFDAGVAYAWVQERWVSCVSEYYADFKGRSEREVVVASQELRQRQLNHSRQFTLTARKLAEFLSSVEAEEVLLEQRLRDAEAQAVFRLMANQPELQTKSNNQTGSATAGDEPVVLTPRVDEKAARVGTDLTIYGDF